MKSEAVSLPVVAGVPLDCSFLARRGWLAWSLCQAGGRGEWEQL